MELSFKKWLEATKLKLTKNRKMSSGSRSRRLRKTKGGPGGSDSPEWTAGWNKYTEERK
jgi:hypothetical protein